MQKLGWSDTLVLGGPDLTLKLKAPKLIADEGWGKTGRKISFFEDIVLLAVPAEEKNIQTTEVINLTSQYDQENGSMESSGWTMDCLPHRPCFHRKTTTSYPR